MGALQRKIAAAFRLPPLFAFVFDPVQLGRFGEHSPRHPA
jgi:hypothetical protein